MAPCAFLCSLESVLSMDIYLSCVEIVLKFSSICEGKGSPTVSTHNNRDAACLGSFVYFYTGTNYVSVCNNEVSASPQSSL